MIRQNIKPPDRLNRFCFLWGLPKRSKPLSSLPAIFLLVYKLTAKCCPKGSTVNFHKPRNTLAAPSPGGTPASLPRQRCCYGSGSHLRCPGHRPSEMIQLCLSWPPRAGSCLLSSAPSVLLFCWCKGLFPAVAQHRIRAPKITSGTAFKLVGYFKC